MLAQTQTQDRIEDPEISPHYYRQSLKKESNAYVGVGNILFNKWWWENCILACGRMRREEGGQRRGKYRQSLMI